uniref:non-specific serine/threonine protein kinase n=1 Tax=Elaeis guineensis var. tenera TaxID=51953 RepID=A0A6I9QQT4_ELAGV|nr:G-type lectin S-receptor-like serine/threonine-protein kinase At1g34300 [Elaeis guineensis]
MGFLFSSSPPALLLLLLLSLSSQLFLNGLPLAGAADIPLGATLTPSNSSSWTSDNRTFSLRFVPDPDNPSLFLAAVTYSGAIRIWTAVGADNTPAAVDSAASLQLRSDGDLRLTNGSGAVVWQSNTSGKGVTAAFLSETGNLILRNRRRSVWQSFDNSTDTILQTQNFTIGQTLKSGLYSFSLNNTGNLTLTWNDSVSYFNKGFTSSYTANKTLISPVLTLHTNGIVSLSDESLPGSVVIAYSSDYAESAVAMRFVRLDSDGNLRAYSVASGSITATSRWSAVADQCTDFGWCGNMGICSYNDTSPVCGCPSKNFEFVDPSDRRKGCKRRTEIEDCPGNSTMLQMDNTLFLTYPPEISTEQLFVGITACRLNCLLAASCAASTSVDDGSGYCYLKASNFVSGYQSPALPSTSFAKVCAPALPNQPQSG